MNKNRLLISTSTFGLIDPAPLERISQAGFDCVLNPYKQTLSTQQLIELLDGVSGLIAGTEKITEEVFKARPHLRIISRCGAGIDNIDLQAAQKYGVAIASTPEAPILSVAELTLGLMLNLMRSLSLSDRLIRAGRWEKRMGSLLSGKTVGIIGFGQVGEVLARLLQPFHVKIKAYDVKPKTDIARSLLVEYVDLNELLKISDVVTIHLPLNPETKNLINAKTLALMKKEAILVNTSRGEIIDEEALYYALKSERITGSALDVFTQEPYMGKLRELNNVVLTSHIGSYTAEARVKMENLAVENVLKFFSTSIKDDK